MYYEGKRDREKNKKARLVLGWAKKLKAIKILGGKCQCGESRPWILEFHHQDDATKEFEISYLKHLSWHKLEKELHKCVLMCRNCHGDLHFKGKFLELESEIKSKTVEISPCEKIDHSLIIELNKQGLTQKKIAETVGCGISTVCEVLKSNGIHTFEKKKTIDPLEVIKLRDDGYTNVEIASIMNIHRFSVPQIIKRWRLKNDPEHS